MQLLGCFHAYENLGFILIDSDFGFSRSPLDYAILKHAALVQAPIRPHLTYYNSLLIDFSAITFPNYDSLFAQSSCHASDIRTY